MKVFFDLALRYLHKNKLDKVLFQNRVYNEEMFLDL